MWWVISACIQKPQWCPSSKFEVLQWYQPWDVPSTSHGQWDDFPSPCCRWDDSPWCGWWDGTIYQPIQTIQCSLPYIFKCMWWNSYWVWRPMRCFTKDEEWKLKLLAKNEDHLNVMKISIANYFNFCKTWVHASYMISLMYSAFCPVCNVTATFCSQPTALCLYTHAE